MLCAVKGVPLIPKSIAKALRHASLSLCRQLVLASFLVIQTGCDSATDSGNGKYVPFTPELIRTYSLSEPAMGLLKFYASKDILLHRQLPAGAATGAKGKLITENGVNLDEVEILPLAPGVPTNILASEDKVVKAIDVRFEAGGPVLRFWSHSEDPKSTFSLDYVDAQHKTDVLYDGLRFSAVNDSISTFLLVDIDALKRMEPKMQVQAVPSVLQFPGAFGTR
jgi:hypothetical protein